MGWNAGAVAPPKKRGKKTESFYFNFKLLIFLLNLFFTNFDIRNFRNVGAGASAVRVLNQNPMEKNHINSKELEYSSRLVQIYSYLNM